MDEVNLFLHSLTESWDWWESQKIGESADEQIAILSNNGITLYLDLYEELNYWLKDQKAEGADCLLANIGGHWLLPGLRWGELTAISKFVHPKLASSVKDKVSQTAFCLLLPIVWICNDDELTEARKILPTIFFELGVVRNIEDALKLTGAWVKTVDARSKFYWANHKDGWITNAQWSERSSRGKQRSLLNEFLIKLAKSQNLDAV